MCLRTWCLRLILMRIRASHFTSDIISLRSLYHTISFYWNNLLIQQPFDYNKDIDKTAFLKEWWDGGDFCGHKKNTMKALFVQRRSVWQCLTTVRSFWWDNMSGSEGKGTHGRADILYVVIHNRKWWTHTNRPLRLPAKPERILCAGISGRVPWNGTAWRISGLQ